MNKNESKYFNTAIKMDNALLELLGKKDFEYITIKEICDTAKVNRSTFYLHYENTVDLLKETTEYVIDTFLSYFSTDTKDILPRIQTCDIKELNLITPEYLTPYLTFIKDNQDIFRTSLKHFHVMDFKEFSNSVFNNALNPIFDRFSCPENDRGYIIKFYLTGITAIIIEWLERDCAEDIDEIIRIISDVIGIHKIEAINSEKSKEQSQ